MMRVGSLKPDGIALGELTVNFLGTSVKVEAKAAFVDTRTGGTHGWTTNGHWSKETWLRLQDLKESMEYDLAEIHCTTHAASSSGSSPRASVGGDSTTTSSGGGGGLGEHVSEDGVSSL